ncbi:MAG TPA: alpha/beta hydrolase [Acidimicrobiales bacterium]|nr:alpha/beta hydrolase [Acidimicrobiales bacterium]
MERIPDDPVTAPLVVLVHGSLDRAASFSRVTRRLPELHTVAYDRRGYNHSRWAEMTPATLDGHIDDLVEVIAGRPAVVVGHSFGGTVALGAAVRPGGPDPILAVGAYEPPLPWLGPWATRQRTGSERVEDRADRDPAEEAERFFRRMVGDEAWERLPDGTKRARRADGAALAAELADIRTHTAPFDVTALTIPAVFGRGSASIPHHRETPAWLHEHVPGSELVEIEGAAHGAHLTHPDAFAQFVLTVLERAAGTGRNRSAAG